MIKYKDRYFDNSSDEYSKELSELSSSLMMISHSKKEMGLFFKKYGFEYDFYNYGSSKKPTSTSGFALGYKISKKYGEICLIVIRGTVNGEWYSNFDLCSFDDIHSDEHHGFIKATDRIMETLDEVFCNKSNIKFLITGHSRGGAVANIAAKKLSCQRSYTKKENVYCYTFAAPNVSKNADVNLKNIFNFVNADDIITAIPLNISNTSWSYKRNGKTINMNINSDNDTVNKRILKYFKQYTGEEFIPIEPGDTRTVIDRVIHLSPSPEDYYNRKCTAYPGKKMSVYDYFKSGIIKILSGNQSMSGGLFLIKTKSGDFATVTSYLMKYASSRLGASSNNMNGLECNHCKELYYSFVKAYNKEKE